MSKNPTHTNVDARISLGFIDSASVHSAMSVLQIGKSREWTKWEQQSLLEVTYLLMSENIRVTPGPSSWYGASGPIEKLFKELPKLHINSFEPSPSALTKMVKWASRNPNQLKGELEKIQSEPVSAAWAASQKDHFWVNHVEMYGGLFNSEFIPQIARILGCSKGELESVHFLSENPSEVRLWLKGKGSKEASELATQSWLVASLMRGRYHEHLAQERQLHLVAHPHRKGIETVLRAGDMQKVPLPAQFFTKMIIGSALLERKPHKRIEQWVLNIAKARSAIPIGRIPLEDAVLASDAERIAAFAAKTIDLPSCGRSIPRLIDYTVAVGLGSLAYISLSPWVVVPSVATLAYRYYRGKSVGDDIARVICSTKAQFSVLGESVPGRIERKLIPLKGVE